MNINAFKELTVNPFTDPNSSLIVNTSRRAWVGCSPVPSPAFNTGFEETKAALCCKKKNRYVKFHF